MQRLFFIFLVGLLFYLADLYVYQAIATVTQNLSTTWQQTIYYSFWIWFVLTVLTFAFTILLRGKRPGAVRTYLTSVLFIIFASKLVVILFLGLEDLLRFFQGIAHYFSDESQNQQALLRHKAWSQAALLAAALPFTAFLYGMVFGAFHYQVKKIKLHFPNLPASFHGFKMIQISDLHTGSFASEKPLKKAVNLINALHADVIFFTGDLVNNVADEVEPYIPVLGKLQGKSGVYSILGNHDYGDYVSWETRSAKLENLARLKHAHARMGWHLLMNQHQILERGSDKIAILGVENWGNRAGFPKYGKLYKAHQGTEYIPFKVLLSHDPSHWDGEVNDQFPDIDLMLAGHTHGMQFGLNLPFIKWSPVQYVYKQWAGLYQKGSQYLYVNVGLGFLGYPGRVGFRPEITVFELHGKPGANQ